MYQVIMMYGDNEPWWFFEDWQEDIIEEQTFTSLAAAEAYYFKKWQEQSAKFTYINTKPNYLSAFWNDDDERWCEECDEDIQQYYGLALLKDYQPVAFENKNQRTTVSNHYGKAKSCMRKAIS
ncbi:DUF1033 family protein [Enterococcus faecalis]